MAETKEDSFFAITKTNDGLYDKELMQVMVRFLRTVKKGESLKPLFEQLECIYARQKKFIITYHAPKNHKESMQNAQALATYLKSKDAESKRLIVGCAVIVESSWLKTTIKSLLLVASPSCPFKACASEQEAQQFLADTIAKTMVA
jgi:ATP phosphoribosyltransferase